MAAYPSCEEEQALIRSGYRLVAGIDEVGRGAWAGPVTAAAVILPPELALSGRDGAPVLDGVRDSKQLTPQRREELWPVIHREAVAIGIGFAPVSIVDCLGVAAAGRLAMRRAISGLQLRPEFLLIDAFQLPTVEIPQKGIVDGDCLCVSIAAASVVAKVARDRLMAALHGEYPDYGFHHNKGYGTPEHYQSLLQNGPCRLHRRTFSPLRDLLLDGGV